MLHYSVKKLLFTVTCEQAGEEFVLPLYTGVAFTSAFYCEWSSDRPLKLLFPGFVLSGSQECLYRMRIQLKP